MFFNDYDVIIDFGKHEGKKIKELPESYENWLLNSVKNRPDITDAIKRIRKRKGVTSLTKNIKNLSVIPEMIEIQTKIKPVHRPSDLNSSMFGSFIEYLVKSYLGLSIDDEPQTLLCEYGLVDVPDHLIFKGDFLEPNQRIRWIYNSFIKTRRSVSDICNLSFTHSISMGHFSEKDASKLFTYVKENEIYFEEYLKTLVLPIPDKDEQNTCDKISVGCVIGVIDMISNDAIVDIKCKQTDDINEYRKQLFAYACLHYLRYGNLIQRCEIYNFLTGKQYVMALGDSCQKHAKNFIKALGDYCPEHLTLFD